MEMRWHVVAISLFNLLVLLAAIVGIVLLVVYGIRYLKNKGLK